MKVWMPNAIVNPHKTVTTNVATTTNPQPPSPIAKPNQVSNAPAMAVPSTGRSRTANSPPGSLAATNTTPKATLRRYFSSSSAISTMNGRLNTTRASSPRGTFRPFRLSANTSLRRVITLLPAGVQLVAAGCA